jgi:hypothetical protein
MPVNVAIAIATFILATSALAMIAFIMKRRREAKEDDMRRAATSRGWQFDSRSERGSRIHRWRGTTDGLAWVAESIRTAPKSNHDKHLRLGRWHGDYNPGINKPIVCMGLPKGKEMPAIPAAPGESMFAKLAQKAMGFAFDKAIDVHFGKELGDQVDAETLHRVDSTKIPGYVVLAVDKAEGVRVLSQGLEAALIEASGDKSSLLSNDNRPWILIRPSGISLGRLERIRDLDELDAFIRAGTGLSRAFTFGRRSLS